MRTCCTFLLLSLVVTASAQLDILSYHGDLAQCDTMTRGIYLVWWDKDFNLGDQVDVLLDTMISYRTTCLDELEMRDPPNPEDGHYYNVYLHNPGNAADIFMQYGWGNGQGTDQNGYPFLTLPSGLISDCPNTAHETFHVFQYNSNAPGFAYSGDSQWYIEASANWFAARENPTHPRGFIEAESLVRLPHVPLWLSYDNFPASYPQNWQRYVHQYAGALWLYYLTEIARVPEVIITEGFFNGTEELPQEYFFNFLDDSNGGSGTRQHFVDWAARMTNHFDFILPAQAAANENEWHTYADPEDDNEFVETYVDSGSDGWYRPADVDVTTAWSFNTYKVRNSTPQTYHFELNGDATGSNGDPSYFVGKVLVQNAESGASFHEVAMANAQQGSLTIEASSADTALYFIIASVPEVFEDANPEFQTFSYEMQISTSTTATQDLTDTQQRTEVARFNLLGQRVDSSYRGVQVILYDDRSVEKVLNVDRCE